MSFLQFTLLEISYTNYILYWMYIIKDKTCHWEQYASLRTEQSSRKLHIARKSMFYLICYTKYTLKRISNWPLYKIWYSATYLISASKVWSLCIVHTNFSINGKKKTFPYKKLSMWNGRCEHWLCARAPRAWQGSCRIW